MVELRNSIKRFKTNNDKKELESVLRSKMNWWR